MQDWSKLHKDADNVMETGAWDYGYELAAAYFPGLDRETFYSFASDYSLAMMEWADVIGEGEPKRKDVDRFYRQGAGLLFNLLRHPRPPDVWSAEKDRAKLLHNALRHAGAQSVIEFGGGIAGTAMQLARWGFEVGYIEVGQTAAFGEWWIRREGLSAPRWHPQPGKVAAYRSLGAAITGAGQIGKQWHAIAALDVLEHLWDPVQQLRDFYDALAPGGIIVITRHSFKLHPTHLERTFWLFEQADAVLAGMGFEPLVPPDGHYGIGAWRKGGVPLAPLAEVEQNKGEPDV